MAAPFQNTRQWHAAAVLFRVRLRRHMAQQQRRPTTPVRRRIYTAACLSLTPPQRPAFCHYVPDEQGQRAWRGTENDAMVAQYSRSPRHGTARRPLPGEAPRSRYAPRTAAENASKCEIYASGSERRDGGAAAGSGEHIRHAIKTGVVNPPRHVTMAEYVNVRHRLQHLVCATPPRSAPCLARMKRAHAAKRRLRYAARVATMPFAAPTRLPLSPPQRRCFKDSSSGSAGSTLLRQRCRHSGIQEGRQKEEAGARGGGIRSTEWQKRIRNRRGAQAGGVAPPPIQAAAVPRQTPTPR